MNLQQGMNFLVNESRMLTGLSVTYGRCNCARTFLLGNAREVFLNQSEFTSFHVPLTADSVFDLASLTKCFTAVLAVLLMREGILDPDASPAQYEPRFVHLDNVRLMDVMTFQVGLKTDGRIDEAPSSEEGLRRLYATVPVPLPRIRLYSDIPAMIIARVLEAVSGKSYMTLLRERVLAPLGMVGTTNTPVISQCLDYRYEYRIQDCLWTLYEGQLGRVHDPKAALLQPDCLDCCGHAGLFSTQKDMQRFAQGLLSGELLTQDELREMGKNRTGMAYPDGTFRQFLGCLCFSKHPDQHLSELPAWMGPNTIGLSGFTGNHLAIDPDSGTFILYLGNRVHHRLTRITPLCEDTFRTIGLSVDGTGIITGPRRDQVPSSTRFVYFKDRCLGYPIGEELRMLGWLR